MSKYQPKRYNKIREAKTFIKLLSNNGNQTSYLVMVTNLSYQLPGNGYLCKLQVADNGN